MGFDLFDNNKFNQDIIKNYDMLKQIGILDEIENFKNENSSLKELLEESIELFNKYTIMDLINYLTKKMLNKFVPSNLAFILQDDLDPDIPNIICFRNMQIIDTPIKIETLKVYRKFFMLSPTSIEFNAFKVMVDDNNLTDVFLPLEPEIVVPMMGPDGMYGFIVFGKKMLEQKYSKQELTYLDWIMKFTSISLQNNIHYRRANIDLKTGLYNHSFFIRRLKEELARLKRHNFDLSVLMIDIDFFKAVNDKYGHLAGDKIIYNLSKIIDDNKRNEDVAARFGGEEFVVLLVDCNKEFAYIVAERIRKTVEGYDFMFESKKIKITISLGVCCISSKDDYTADALINNADTALYYSKKHNRNRTTIFSEELNSGS
jgi:diguanylate cyclase (GGDEF)-like protein